MNKPYSRVETVCFSVPSKTFLLGEYAVLANHPAVIANTTPRFSVLMSPLADPALPCEYIHFSQQGAIALLRQQINVDCHGYRFIFIDPHQEAGGLGASSAQYALLFAAYQQLTQQQWQHTDCLARYQKHNDAFQQLYQPSGADLMAQLNGGLSIFDPKLSQCDTLTWPWHDLHCVFLRTSHKTATHQHLATLNTFPEQTLADCSLAGIAALQQSNQTDFIAAIQTTAACLLKAELTHPSTASLLTHLIECPFVLAAKGCGALGADVIATVIPTENLALFHTWLQNSPLTYVSDTQHLAAGLTHSFLPEQQHEMIT